MKPTVTIAEQGREGRVTYTEGLHSISGYQEFGGGDVVAIVSMGRVEDWRKHHSWALQNRSQILRFVAEEVIRQKAPTCSADIDEASGDILVRSGGAGSVRPTAASSGAARTGQSARGQFTRGQSPDVSWVYRYRDLKMKFALIVLAATLVLGAAWWVMSNVFVVQPGRGTPLGSTVRGETHLATLISQMQPYTPSLHHDPSTERFTVSVFLVPLDGAPPKTVRLVRDLRAGGYSLSRVIGSDGQTLWTNVNGLYGVNLRTHALVTSADVIKANPGLPANRMGDTRGMDIVDGRLRIVADDRSVTWTVDPATLKATPVAFKATNRSLSNPPLTLYTAAGVLLPPNGWLGVQASGDLERGFRTGRWLRPVESASEAQREGRRLMRGEMAPSSDNDGLLQIRSMTPVDATEYFNASFLRLNEKSPPLRVANPDSVLMLHNSGDGGYAPSTLLVSRVETASGKLLWTVDTAIHRFKLEQIMPAERTTVFVGTRLPIPDKLSEPLIVILDHATGQLTTHSLWQ